VKRPVKLVKVVSQVVLVWSELRQRYVKGHPCILKRACPLCRAKKGEPCFGPNGHNHRAERHYVRTDAWQERLKREAAALRAARPARAGTSSTRRAAPKRRSRGS